ncbi:MAG TPA: alpha/beta hydrolase [Roseateles sp.]|nr:alpha/beta hydrolase [Roseateles sp.]
MSAPKPLPSAIDTPNQYVESHGRRLAYRSLGSGKPIVLCTRFRGTMDVWDPAFLDALARAGLRVITFDYSGLGSSGGDKDYNPMALAGDARDLIEALDLHEVVIAGWSLGGMVAQVVLALYPQRLSHAVLLGTTPPGPIVKPAEQLFYEVVRHPVNDLADETILFFEPRSAASRAAAERSAGRIRGRSIDPSPPVPADWAAEFLGDRPRIPPFPAEPVLQALKNTRLPVLHIGGDHDIVFPVENWYALNQQLPTVQLLTYPNAGHGPHQQHPEAAAAHIAAFLKFSSA